MRNGFFKKISLPLYTLAPLANVTDAAFRRIIAKYGKPDIMYTEFVSCDGLCSEGREKLLVDLSYTEQERPIVAQVFGSKPENFYKTAILLEELGFDGIDINMGCPDKNVLRQGAGAALIKEPELAKKIIRETMRGAPDLPVSVKTRIGYTKNTIREWLPHLLETKLAAITIHGRTMKEMSLVPAHWDVIGEGAQIAKKYDSSLQRTLIIGNGDVQTLGEAQEKVLQYGVDGVMIGRGIFGNPWLFNRAKNQESISLNEKLSVMVEHTFLFEKLFSEIKPFDVMKKHYKAYVTGFDGARELRARLMSAATADEVYRIVSDQEL